jgi:CheY-like chemotaxis protein
MSLNCLIVDNAPVNRDFVVRSLQAARLSSCDEATNLPEALARLRVAKNKKNPYKVLIVSVALDSLAVEDILKAIKEMGGYNSLLALTPDQDKSLAQEVIKLGAHSYFAMPLNEARFISKIKPLLGA